MEFFAGANSRYGFKSIFDECFKNVKRLFILKGSSGCGKSTLMRRIAGQAGLKGFKTHIIRCSADPDSLDGVIIPELEIAIVDGTSPHTMDVRYPCVRETIINLGQFWDEKKLLPQRERIISLTDKKSRHYANAYKCLSAMGAVEDAKMQMIMTAVKREKTDDIAFETVEKSGLKKGSETEIFAMAFTANGFSVLPVFGRVKKLKRIIGAAAPVLVSAIRQVASEQGCEFITSLSCIDPSVPDSIYFEESSTLITALETPPCESAEEETTVSCAGFTDNAVISGCRVRLRTMEKLIAELANEAKTELALAKAVHNEIEAVYIPAMDFVSLDDYTLMLMENIFSE